VQRGKPGHTGADTAGPVTDRKAPRAALRLWQHTAQPCRYSATATSLLDAAAGIMRVELAVMCHVDSLRPGAKQTLHPRRESKGVLTAS